MITNKFQELTLSGLGFGAMRLPLKEEGGVDEQTVNEMVDYALAHGINYFDTAWPYHGGLSEKIMGRALGRYPRDSYFLATKYPGHQIASTYHPADIFEKQLAKCNVEYFDFYLLHNVYENSIQTYMDGRWNILDYFLEQKRLGRIRHLGFSSHGGLDILEKFLDYADGSMEFCQIQLNYLDWTLQQAKEKYELLSRRNIPVWVMEPVRGGKLASLPADDRNQLKRLRPEEKTTAWAFRFLQGLPNVKMILSGMSSMEQMVENVQTFETDAPLTEEEMHILLDIAEGMKDSIPCTACRYCVDGCPMGLDIPMLISAYNELRFEAIINVSMRLEGFPEEKQPAACIGCGKCAKICPQSIDVPGAMKGLAAELEKLPSWTEICRQRDEEARRNS